MTPTLEGKRGFMSSNQSDKEFWQWFQKGVDNDWITDTFCLTHDAGYEQMTDEERQEWEDGGDPCCHVVKFLNN